MGVFTAPIRVENPDDLRCVELEAAVSTAASYTFLAEDVPQQLGIERASQRGFELADNRVVEYPIGYVRFQVNGYQAITFVVFKPPDTTPL